MFVIVNDEGLLYGGFDSEKSKPIWFKAKKDKCELPEDVADTAVRQLQALGFDKVVKRPAGAVVRKWVPEDMDATRV